MGFRYRKTFGKGPFKMTVSKSGIGYSVGTKGFRVTKKAGGGVRTTASIPGAGISYTSDSKKSSRKSTKSSGSSAKSSGGCLTSCLWGLGVFLVIGLVASYWKVLLGIGIAALAAYIGISIYRKKHPKALPEAPAEEEPDPAIEEKRPESEVKIYHAAGVNYYLDALFAMMEPNYLYSYKKQDLIDCCKYEENIYKQTVTVDSIDLSPEPDNPHDPNAIRILLNGKLVGYIPAADCARLLEAISEGRIENIYCEVSGGKYKRVCEDYDAIKDRSTYKMENGEDDYGITLHIREKLK